MTPILSTITVGSTNITSRVAFGSAYTVTADRLLSIGAAVTGLNGAAATLMVDVEITRGGNVYGGPRYPWYKRSAASTRELMPDMLVFPVLNGDSVQVYMHSPVNANDTAVSGSIYISDPTIAFSADTTQWAGASVTGMPMPTYAQPAGFLAATFPATLASTTNIVGGTITTVTTVNGLAANSITAAAIALDAADEIAARVEYHLIDEADGQTIINAIVGAIGNTNVDEVALVASIRSDMERSGGNLDTLLARLSAARAGYLDKLNVAGTLAHTDNADTFKADISGLLTASAFTTYAPATATALGTLSTTVGTLLTATAFTNIFGSATLASGGVFTEASLANAPVSDVPETPAPLNVTIIPTEVRSIT